MKTKWSYILLICSTIAIGIIALYFFETPNDPVEDISQLRKADLIYVAKLKDGFSPWIYIQLYDSGLLEVSASYYTHALTYDNTDAFEYTLFSDKLQNDDFQELKEWINNLPPIQPETIYASDIWIYHSICNGEEMWFTRYSVANRGHAMLVERMIELSEVDLYSTYSLPWPE